jgi:hypothetical protein
MALKFEYCAMRPAYMLNVAERLMDKAQAAIKKIANMSALQIGQLPAASCQLPAA